MVGRDKTRVVHATNSAKSGPPPERTPSPTPPPPPPPTWGRWLLLLLGGLITALLFFNNAPAQPTVKAIAFYPTFQSDVSQGQVRSVSIDPSGAVQGTFQHGSKFSTQIPTALSDSGLVSLLEKKNVQIQASSGQSSGTLVFIEYILINMLPLVLVVGLLFWFGRRASRQLGGMGGMGGIANVGRSRAKVFDAEKPSTLFSDVAGYEGAKQEVSEVVDFLKHPDRYRRAGARGPRGVLMVGPPGTGKTLLARAVAGEAGVPFLSVSGSSFVEMFVGVGAARVRDLFADARKRAPSIIFIDEIDAIGSRRGAAMIANDERDQTLNQMLAEMDGFDLSAGVVVIAATNRPEVLDPALLRPGRFDRQVTIPLPTQGERRAILEVHSTGKRLGEDVDLTVVARGTPGFSGADLANLVNEAAIFAVRAGREVLSAEDFAEARDRILLGRRDSSNALLPAEKRAVAVHEGGHALVAALSEHADPVAKVTILPAGQALGVTEQLPVDERHLYSEGYLKDSLAVRLGGRAAELLIFGETSTGASNDLAGATQLATRMVREFGMSDALGPVGFSTGAPGYLGQEDPRGRPYAESTQRVIDEEVARLLREAADRSLAMLAHARPQLDELTALLLERETIDGIAIDDILRRHQTEAPEHRAPVGLGHGASPSDLELPPLHLDEAEPPSTHSL